MMEDFPEGGPGPFPTADAIDDEEFLAHAFEGVAEEQYDLNRRAASRAQRLADALDFARRHPHIYAYSADPTAEQTAERCAVLEASSRLHISENIVRSLATMADTARQQLPLLWRNAREGFVPLSLVESAVELLGRFAEHPAAVADFDRLLAEVALHSSASAFRAKAKALTRRLAPLPDAELHAAAFVRRRVMTEPVADGMSWINLYVATVDAVAINRRAHITAKTMAIKERAGRTLEQVRADLLCGWLRGTGTKTAVKTKVFVTVPLDKLTPQARATARGKAIAPGADLNAEPILVGHDAVDGDTARHLLLEAGEFTRVITDPVTGVILDMDRRSRKVTRAQREWLILHHGTCTRDGCRRPAAEADIDHMIGFNSEYRGPTDIANLHPMCVPDHALKDTTRIRFRRREDLTIQLVSPTGFRSRRWREPGVQYGDDPPF